MKTLQNQTNSNRTQILKMRLHYAPPEGYHLLYSGHSEEKPKTGKR